MKRLTHERVNGIKTGYWTQAKKDELVARLAAYEDTGLTPEEITRGKMLTGWIPCSERLPEAETEVLVQTNRSGSVIITTAIYEDGEISTEDSIWCWYDLDFEYLEEKDIYLIPEGWWEYCHYNPDDVYNRAIDDIVIAWQPLPEPWKGEQDND